MRKLTHRTAQPKAMRSVSAEFNSEPAYLAQPELSTRKKIRNAVFKLGALAGIGASVFVGVKERSTITDKLGGATADAIEAITPITAGEIEKQYKNNLKPVAVDIAQRAIELSERPDGVFKVSDGDLSTSSTITASGANKYGYTTRASIELGRTDGKPDPEKVRSIFMKQPQGGNFPDSQKALMIYAPEESDSKAWEGRMETVRLSGIDEMESNLIDVAWTNPANSIEQIAKHGNYDPQGEASAIAGEATKMFAEIAKDLQQ